MKTWPSGKRGFILAASLIIVSIIFILMAAICNWVMSEKRFAMQDLNMRKAYYLAETGIETAYNHLNALNFDRYTHDSSNNPLVAGHAKLLPSDMNNITRVSIADAKYPGWYKWTWAPGNTYDNFNGGSIPETFYYRIYPENNSDENPYYIESVGIYGDETKSTSITKRFRCIVNRSIFDYVYFANSGLGEFTRGVNQTITGKIHSNGDLYFAPDHSTLTIKADKVTAAGRIYRYRDIWGRTGNGGNVYITKNNQGSPDLPEMTSGAAGTAFDSFNANWSKTDITGADLKWGKVVQDSKTPDLVQRKNPPDLKTFAPGGYYDVQADSLDPDLAIRTEQNRRAHITATSADGPIASHPGLTKCQFWNAAEGRYETVIDIKLNKLNYADTDAYTPPVNGVIYCTTPIRFSNAGKITSPHPNGLTVVSTCNIYTMGDFNTGYTYKDASLDPAHPDFVYVNTTKDFDKATMADPQACQDNRISVPLMTSSRIYPLSNQWSDAAHPSGNNTATATKSTGIYASIVDNSLTVKEINHVPSYGGVANAAWKNNPEDTTNGCWANCDDLLENWSGKRLTKRGPMLHYENADMCHVKNTTKGWNVNDDWAPGKCSWIVRRIYSPPTRDYAYDVRYSDVNKQPPTFPRLGTRLYMIEFYQ